ncbi:hypothetical protein QN277_025844 [Acacia crassicarpa]|uniref:Uncharacterized protein n=1 Tax=Acacia crassicarpa TaxID=499986 RepID=A0AAE1J6P3_9FABA|nr:hypothetical protein QN277_025844 [Acacia crassicarpa]
MALSIPRRSRKRKTPHPTSTVEDEHGGGRRPRKILKENEDGERWTTSTAVSPEQSTKGFFSKPASPSALNSSNVSSAVGLKPYGAVYSSALTQAKDTVEDEHGGGRARRRTTTAKDPEGKRGRRTMDDKHSGSS